MSDPVAPWTHNRPWRNYNPGDLRPRSHVPSWPGQVAIDHGPGGPFAIFGSRPDGWSALALWLLYAHDVMGLKTTAQKIAVFAPPSENETASYAAGVAAKVGENANPHDVATRIALCKAIAHWEDYQAQWPEPEITSGMMLCDARWPRFLSGLNGPAPQGGFPDHPDPDNSADALNAAELNKPEQST